MKIKSPGDFLVLIKNFSKVFVQLVYGVWKVAQMPKPIVTIFGGTRLALDHPFSKMAHELAHKLARENISVITGGGPGIMAAASCTFVESPETETRAKTLGITVRGLEREATAYKNCDYERIVLDYFFARKWLMINYAVAFAVFPGGFGTVDEMAEVATLMQTQKLPGVPLVLVGVDYWQPFMNWLRDSALKYGLVSQDDVDMLYLTDDIDEAVALLKQRCVECALSVHEIQRKSKEELKHD